MIRIGASLPLAFATFVLTPLRTLVVLCVAALALKNLAIAGIYSANDPAIIPLAGHVVAGAGNITVDPLTGFAWLDTTLSVGLTYNDVVAGLAPGGAFSGYRLATNGEVTSFWRDAGIPVPFGGEGAPVGSLRSLWGSTTQNGWDVNVFTGTPYPPVPTQASVLQIIDRPSDSTDTVTATPQFGVAFDQAEPGIAAALVRAFIPPLSEVILSGYDPNIRSLPNHQATGPGNVTVDTISNQRWVDSSLTRGFSHDAVAAELGPGGAFAGYRFAHNEEILDLFRHAAILPQTSSQSPEIISLMHLMGFTFDPGLDSNYHTCMITADRTFAPPAYDLMHMVEDSDSLNRRGGERAEVTGSAFACWSGNTGVALVQQVPEPSTLALAALGIVGLMIAARRSRLDRHIARGLLVVAFASCLLARTASAVPVLIDDFSPPVNSTTYIIGLLNPDPSVLKQAGGLGGERDLLVDVLGAANSISAVGTVGGGQFQFGTTGSAGSLATLQYDGVDLLDTAGALQNAFGLNADLTGGQPSFLRLAFLSVDAAAANSMSVRITATSAGASASFVGTIAENANPSNFTVPLSSFTTVGTFDPRAVTSLQFTFNEAGVKDVDFTLDEILVFQVPEPSTMALLACGSLAIAAGLRRRRA